MPEPALAHLTIDLDALAHNYGVIRAEAVGAEVAPVVKANGYGLGAVELARRLWAEGARSFFVARTAEGTALRAGLGPERPATIYVLDGLTVGAGPVLLADNLTPVLTSLPQVTEASALARALGRALPVGLHVDTGMNRQGVTPDEARALAQSVDRLRGLDLQLVMSHLGSAPEPDNPRNRQQLERFVDIRGLFPDARASLAASAGSFLGPDFRFDLVRPGVSLYGGGPLETPDPRLRAVAIFTAPILDIRNVQAGELIGYGGNVRVDRPTRVAMVAAGYADGVIRAGRGEGYAWYAGARRTLLISNMDLLAIDIGDAPAHVGDAVELLGPNAPLDDFATAAGTVAHEVLVRLSPRAGRTYVGKA
ncbi:alanine racemase [Phenylobacterium deserti]|uniref:Alanine racemase n=1 Tax=Phenylobacterium deserti TaxID=1914756 RepID=A0A328AHA1_9CAUL|nr:alanine racemase [Phenylobacterium deserti]RAK52238.1 alanine racemase [Phenylobacterium deserti]